MRFLMKVSKIILVCWLCIMGVNIAFASPLSIIGDWQTIDHVTNRPSSIIRIWQDKDTFFGKVVRIFPENGHKASDRCVHCKGDLQNHRILGLTIIRDMVFDRDKYKYVDGRILDPTNGKVYRCYMRVSDYGRRLMVRGYIGFSLLGRTDVWYRVLPCQNQHSKSTIPLACGHFS